MEDYVLRVQVPPTTGDYSSPIAETGGLDVDSHSVVAVILPDSGATFDTPVSWRHTIQFIPHICTCLII